LVASEIDSCDTPRRLFLKRGVRQLSDEVKLKNKKLKLLQQTARRQSKKIASLKSIIHNLQKKNLINDEATNTLLDSFGKHSDLITYWPKKKCWETTSTIKFIEMFNAGFDILNSRSANYIGKKKSCVRRKL